MKDPKAKVRSIQDRLRVVANKTGAAYENILTEFLIERLLIRLLSEASLARHLVFKGGYVSLRVYDSPRFTVDLDALLTRGKLKTMVNKAVVIVEKNQNDGTWFKYEKSVDLQTQGKYGGLRLVFRAGLGDISKDPRKGQLIHFDIGAGDPITPGPRIIEMHSLIGTETITWSVYPIETTAAEKLNSLVRRSLDNSRSKDIFDLHILLPSCNLIVLKKAIEATFTHCGDPIPDDIVAHLKTVNTEILRRGWKSAVADIRPIPDFDDTFDSILSHLKKLHRSGSK